MISSKKLLLISLLIIGVLAILFLLWGTHQRIALSSPYVESQGSVPESVIREINNIRLDNQSYFSRWDANVSEHLVTVYFNCSIKYGNMKPEVLIDGWTLRRAQDPELFNQTSIEAYTLFIENWGESHPLQKIGYSEADACTKRVFVTLLNSTPDTLGSSDMVDGWQIIFVQAT